MAKPRKSKLNRELFFRSNGGYETTYYYPTALTLAIAFAVLLAANMGNAFCLVRWLSESGIMSIDWSVISWASPVLGNAWANLALTLACTLFLGREISIRHGASGRLRLIEKIKWGSRSEARAHAERKMYDEYKSTYAMLERFFELRRDNMAPGAWSKMNAQLMGIYDMLSMGQGRRSCPLADEIGHLSGDDEMFQALVGQMRAFKEELSDLLDIWTSAYGFNGVRVGYGSERDDEPIERAGKNMGIDSIIEGYYDGVPLEDLLA